MLAPPSSHYIAAPFFISGVMTMRKLALMALVSSLFSLSAMATPPSAHDHAGGHDKSAMTDKDAHGDAVSAEAKDARLDGAKVGTDVRDVARDKANGKGLTKEHGKGH